MIHITHLREPQRKRLEVLVVVVRNLKNYASSLRHDAKLHRNSQAAAHHQSQTLN